LPKAHLHAAELCSTRVQSGPKHPVACSWPVPVISDILQIRDRAFIVETCLLINGMDEETVMSDIIG